MQSVETLGIMRGGGDATFPLETQHGTHITRYTGWLVLLSLGITAAVTGSSESTNCGDIEVQGGRAQLLLLTYCR